jgi:biotin operon repressor
MEVWPPKHVQELQEVGMSIDRRVSIPGGPTATLMRLTREEALARPYSRFSVMFFPQKPRFRLSAGEQRLIEYALQDVPDDKITQELHLSEDAVKKRWRSIHSKVETVDPRLLEECKSGAGRRKALLHYLKDHLEELRPYNYAVARQGL